MPAAATTPTTPTSVAATLVAVPMLGSTLVRVRRMPEQPAHVPA